MLFPWPLPPPCPLTRVAFALEHDHRCAFTKREPSTSRIERTPTLGIERREGIEAAHGHTTKRIGRPANNGIDQPKLEPCCTHHERIGSARARARQRSHARERAKQRCNAIRRRAQRMAEHS